MTLMLRDPANNRHMREHIAHLAARLMAVDGIDDFALAKRKAARQAGAQSTRNLPDNDEIASALRTYQTLYQPDEQRERLRQLRIDARTMMELLAGFDPYLSGTVASGIAGKYSTIHLLLFTDSVKDVELFLLGRSLQYRTGDRRVHIGQDFRDVPTFNICNENADFTISVFTRRDLRAPIRYSPDGRPLERIGIDWLNAALAEQRSGQV